VDLSCIISSGDLELYILGMLPEEEAYKITQLAQLFPEVQAELDRIGESLEGLSAVAAASPSPSVKNGLMNKLRQLKEEEGSSALLEKSAEKVKDQSFSETPVVSLSKSPRKKSFLVAASIIGWALILTALVYVINQSQKSKTELAVLKQEIDTLRTNADTQQQQILAYKETMQMMHDDSYKKIELSSVPGKPAAMAQVFWDTKTKYVYIADVSLPLAPSDKQYQLWAIVDGKPVDAGMLSDAKNLAQKMKVFEKAEMFAITLEKKGGSPTPTMEQMYVAGKV
jgi:anti-sigma-K factor RskA